MAVLPFCVLVRTCASKPPRQELQAINPDVIEHVRPIEVQGFGGTACSEMQVGDKWYVVIGDVPELIRYIAGIVPDEEEEPTVTTGDLIDGPRNGLAKGTPWREEEPTDGGG